MRRCSYDVPAAATSRVSCRCGTCCSKPAAHADDHDHVHADAVTVAFDGCADPTRLDLLENPPAGVYRLKGVVAVRYRTGDRHYVVNLVGTTIHVAPARLEHTGSHLVAIGMHLDADDVRARLQAGGGRPGTRRPAYCAACSATAGSAFDLGQPPPPLVAQDEPVEFEHRQRTEHLRGGQTRFDGDLVDRARPRPGNAS